MASDLVLGKFELSKSDKFDDFLSELGVNMVKRKVACAATPVITIAKDGDEYTMKTASTFKTSEIKFKLGEEFDEERQDGAKVKSTITADGNKLVHVQKADKNVEIVREFTQEGMNAVATVNHVVSTRFYKRL
ncbi:fatty acid-biding protein-like protein [Leptotrombidium deliense]|uniref:Fatty acid-binding protein n=1 Tax=Leptotrombidium deliense TaxID=299467 RepID=A0A443SL95_9ACAR|nr:fatty acid-biding protein-like protein [Leptotrombidium deliense]